MSSKTVWKYLPQYMQQSGSAWAIPGFQSHVRSWVHQNLWTFMDSDEVERRIVPATRYVALYWEIFDTGPEAALEAYFRWSDG